MAVFLFGSMGIEPTQMQLSGGQLLTPVRKLVATFFLSIPRISTIQQVRFYRLFDKNAI